ncbi:MipA/OmpV family protein [Rhizorhapis sp. SPR117]|uniref:MipA/OmpV family protein n=1 Tax=Rhizorhapis sp. SPR117 TaxID=2912611 RepID=UPI001F44A67C|nr:MipA/OmpV family protein [Rhizorhapis sp. SPR117]
MISPRMLAWTIPSLLLAIPSVHAQESADPAVPAVDLYGDTLTVAVGGAYLPSYDGSDDYVATPGALVRGRVSNIVFFTRGTTFFIDALPDRNDDGWDFEVGPVANLRLDRNSQIKDVQVKALGKFDKAFELGGWIGVAKTGVITSAYDNLSFRVSYLRDMGNVHDSYIITPSIEYGTPLSTTAYVGLSLSADYVGKGYGRTYFGVTPGGALASGLPAYAVSGSGFKAAHLSAFATKSLTGDLTHGLSIGAGLSYGRILGKYADSPIVAQAGDADQWRGALGLAYTF